MLERELAASGAFKELTENTARFLATIPNTSIGSGPQKGDPAEVLRRLEKMRDDVAAGEKVDMTRIQELLDEIGVERSTFEKAATEIHEAARQVHREIPALAAANPSDVRSAVFKAHAEHSSATQFVSGQTGLPPDTVQTVIYGGDPGQVLDADLSDMERCVLECNLAAGMEFGEALAEALQRSIFCAGLAVAVGLAFICLAVVAVAYVIAAKAAQEAAERCLAACG